MLIYRIRYKDQRRFTRIVVIEKNNNYILNNPNIIHDYMDNYIAIYFSNILEHILRS